MEGRKKENKKHPTDEIEGKILNLRPEKGKSTGECTVCTVYTECYILSSKTDIIVKLLFAIGIVGM